MGGLREVRFGGSGERGMREWRTWDEGVETVSADGGETGSVTKKKGKSTSGIKRGATKTC